MPMSKDDQNNKMKKLKDEFEGVSFNDDIKNKIKEKTKEYGLRFHSFRFIDSKNFLMPEASYIPGRLRIYYDANNIISSINNG